MNINMKQTLTTLVLGTVMTTSSMAAQPLENISNQELLDAAMPEHSQIDDSNKSSGSVNMKCFVDTPAWETYKGPVCRSTGSAFTTSAAFKVFNLPSHAKVVWSTPGCPAYQADLCLKPINQNQQLTAFANIVDKNTGQVITTVSATAYYYGFFR